MTFDIEHCVLRHTVTRPIVPLRSIGMSDAGGWSTEVISRDN